MGHSVMPLVIQYHKCKTSQNCSLIVFGGYQFLTEKLQCQKRRVLGGMILTSRFQQFCMKGL
ncbi:hypothetical protein Peur_027988 [Populus x canadensis]|uniref:Uncharacterized protein n=1 Tax=Populus trichocarpa TaxID=3694 RepID=A0A3N7FVY1_POPTR